MFSRHQIIQDVQKNGINKCQDFLNKDNFETLKKVLIDNRNFKGTKNSFFYRSKGKFLLKKLFNFEFASFLDSLKLFSRMNL